MHFAVGGTNLNMSATVISESVIVASQDMPSLSSSSTKKNATTTISEAQIEIESANCDCCGLTEECTPAYIERIRERYAGKWICGLCAEAVKDEIFRSDRPISTEEALTRQLNICRKFRSSWPPATDPTVHLISAVRKILRRSLDCPRGVRSTPASPARGSGAGGKNMMTGTVLARSGSCFPSISS
ncbi:hypothetical protein V2J09_004593 [Rumex salicifolius]